MNSQKKDQLVSELEESALSRQSPEQKALHEALTQMGFKRLNSTQNPHLKLFVLRHSDGVVNLPVNQTTSFDCAIRAIGCVYFNKTLGSSKSRRLHFDMIQQLMVCFHVWNDSMNALQSIQNG
jgi:hypothetical protein